MTAGQHPQSTHVHGDTHPKDIKESTHTTHIQYMEIYLWLCIDVWFYSCALLFSQVCFQPIGRTRRTSVPFGCSHR